MARPLAFVALGATFVAGCYAHGPLDFWPHTPTVVQQADYEKCGPEPSRADAEDVVKRYAMSVLKDPYSALWRNTYVVRRGQWRSNGEPVYGWFIMFEINAKNSFGGYTGFSSEVVLRFSNGDFYYGDREMTGEFLYSMR